MTDSSKEHIPELAKPLNNEESSVFSGAADMLRAAAYTSIQQPLNGLTQVVRHVTPMNVNAPDLISAPTKDNLWTKTGGIAGSVVDYFVLSKGVGSARSSMLGKASTVPILEAGTTGAMFEFTQPVADDNNFAASKLKNMAVGFGTFATIDGAAMGLNKLQVVKEAPAFIKAVGVNGISGGAGGFSHSLLDAGLSGKVPTYTDMMNDVGSYAAFGVMFGALDHGVTTAKGSITAKINDRISHGEPIFSVGPIEVHPRNFYKTARESAQVDALTGLKNKAGGSEVLKSEIARTLRSGDPLSMTYVDLDGFKAVNDKFGHNHGDVVLKEVADFMKQFYHRGTDVPIREGGDEFMMIMPNTPLKNADSLAAGFEKTMRMAVGKTAPTTEQLSENYPHVIEKLQDIPPTIEGGAGQDLSDLAEQLVFARMRLTGEGFNPETINAEVKRLEDRTGLDRNADLGGKAIQVYNDADIANLAQKASFGFLPHIGQLLKTSGTATEAQIQEAFKLQAEYPKENRPLIGRILVEKGYATSEQVDAAFSQQMAAKEALSRILESTPGIDLASAGIRPFRLPHRVYIPADITPMRDQIPAVTRPVLNPNGVRPLGAYGMPTPGEVVVGASTGVVEFKAGESLDDFKHRGDGLMFDKKAERKAKGLRKDRETTH